MNAIRFKARALRCHAVSASPPLTRPPTSPSTTPRPTTAAGRASKQSITVNVPYGGNSYGIYIIAEGTKNDASINNFIDIDAVQCF